MPGWDINKNKQEHTELSVLQSVCEVVVILLKIRQFDEIRYLGEKNMKSANRITSFPPYRTFKDFGLSKLC